MTKLQVIPATAEHLVQVKPRGVCYPPGITYGLSENSYAFIWENEPIAVIGGIVAKGIMSAWGVISDDVMKCPVQFHNEVRRLQDEMFKKHELRRMQMTVRKGYLAGKRWAEKLGFEYEGVMRKFEADGEDSWLFARVT